MLPCVNALQFHSIQSIKPTTYQYRYIENVKVLTQSNCCLDWTQLSFISIERTIQKLLFQVITIQVIKAIHRSNTFYYRFEYIGDMDYLKSYLILFTSSTKVKVIEPSKIQVVLQKSTRLEYLCMLSLRLKNLRDPLFKEAREGIIEFKVFFLNVPLDQSCLKSPAKSKQFPASLFRKNT